MSAWAAQRGLRRFGGPTGTSRGSPTTNCRDCGEPIQFLGGDRRPYDLTPRVHYANPVHIAAVRKDGATARRQPRKTGDVPATNPAAPDAVLALVGLGIKEREATKFVGTGPGDTERLIREALNRRETEKHAKTA